MSLEIWAAFALASIAILAIPGPTILLVCSYAMSAGRRAGLWMVLGVSLGDLVAMTASVLGLGALLLSSGELLTLLRWVGAAYLVYLGWGLWTAPVQAPSAGAAPALSGPKMAAHAFAVTATNPKGIVFFVAFTPQFLNPAAPLWPQLALLTATFVVLAALNTALYALLAERMSRQVSTPAARRLMNRLGGGALIALGVAATVSDALSAPKTAAQT